MLLDSMQRHTWPAVSLLTSERAHPGSPLSIVDIVLQYEGIVVIIPSPYGRQQIIISGTGDLQLHVHTIAACNRLKQVEMRSAFQANTLVDRHHKQVENKKG